VLVTCSKEGRNQTCLKGDGATLFRRDQVQVKERLFIPKKFLREGSSGRNSLWRICEVPRAIRSCKGARGVMEIVFQRIRSKEIGPYTQSNEGFWITCELSFREFMGWRTESLELRFAELRSPKPRKGRKFRCGASTRKRVTIRHFGILGNRRLGYLFQDSQNHETRYKCGG
jgi:hypothetical protein